MKPYWKVALSYLAFGVAWILFSDKLGEAIADSARESRIYQTCKGLFFVSLSAGLIFLLTKHSFEKQARDEHRREAAIRKTVAGAHRILRNYLNQMQLVAIEADNCVDFDRETLALAQRISEEATEGLERLDQVARAGHG